MDQPTELPMENPVSDISPHQCQHFTPNPVDHTHNIMAQPTDLPMATPISELSPNFCAPNPDDHTHKIVAQPTGLPMANLVSVIGPQYCAPTPVDLAIVRKVLTITAGNFAVTDLNGNIMFKVKGSFFTVHDRRVLLDAAGNPIVTLRQKIMSMHKRWKVFKGESTDDKDLLFTVKQSSIIQLKTNLDVFLAENTKEEVCDFKVKGSWLERSCVIYAGESSTIVAQMHKKHSVESVLLGKTKFTVTVYPNIDHAFIVALIVILDDINHDDDE